MHRDPSASGAQETRRPAAPSPPRLQMPPLCDALEEMVFVLDPDGRVLHANRAAHERLGRPADELLGMRFCDLYAPDAREQVATLLSRATADGSVQTCALTLVCKDGRSIDAETRLVPGPWDDRQVVFVAVRELLEAEQVIQRLREIEGRYRFVTEHVVDVLFILRFKNPIPMPKPGQPPPSADVSEVMESWYLPFVTPSIERLLGYTAEEIMAVSTRQLMTPESARIVYQDMAEDLPVALAKGPEAFKRRIHVLQFVRKDGSLVWGEIASQFALDAEGRLAGLVGMMRDVTDRKQAEQAREEQERRFRTLVENMPDFVALLDAQGIMLYMNRESIAAPTSEMLGSDGLQTLRVEYRPLARECVERAVRTGEVQRLEVEDIIGRHFSCRMVPVGDDPATRQVVLIATDVTQQHRFRESLLREQQLLRRLLDLHEQERQLTACEIHDGVAQQLVAARFQFEASQQFQAADPQAAAAAFAKGLELLDQGLAEARRVISGSRPPILDEQGVVAAVEYFIASLRERLTVEIKFTHAMRDGRLPGLLETTIFRVIQEAVTNACRHSQSPKVAIQLVQLDESVQVTVRDWGVGFDPQQVSASRFGLQGIRERARLLGGRAELDTAPGKGTTVRVELPLVGPQDEPPA